MEQQQEEFRSIPGYEGLYEVSNFGNVKSLGNDTSRKEKILRTNLAGSIGRGYYGTILCKDGKQKRFSTHVLVAMAFLGHVPDGTHKIVVDHIDNNRLNNHVNNLQLISNRENLSKDKKNGSSKYTGVVWHKNANKWKSQIQINGKFKHLGYFTSEEEANQVYQNALKMYHEGDLSFMEPKEYSSKYKGVSWYKNANKWVANIQINCKNKHLGYFTSEEDAYEAYKKVLKIYNDGGDLSFMKPKEYSSKYTGVFWNKRDNKWVSQIKINGKKKHLGYFISEEEAHEAYQKALEEKMNTN